LSKKEKQKICAKVNSPRRVKGEEQQFNTPQACHNEHMAS